MQIIHSGRDRAASILEYQSQGASAQPLADGAGEIRRQVMAGQGAAMARGEVHSKGNDAGCSAIMIQLAELTLVAEPA